MLQHVRDIFCPHEQKHVFSLYCSMLVKFFVPQNRTMFYQYAAACQEHYLSHRTETYILTMLLLVSDIFPDIEQKHVFLLCCTISGTFFVPQNRNRTLLSHHAAAVQGHFSFFIRRNRTMYFHYATAYQGHILSSRTGTCILTMLQPVRDVLCPIEQ